MPPRSAGRDVTAVGPLRPQPFRLVWSVEPGGLPPHESWLSLSGLPTQRQELTDDLFHAPATRAALGRPPRW